MLTKATRMPKKERCCRLRTAEGWTRATPVVTDVGSGVYDAVSGLAPGWSQGRRCAVRGALPCIGRTTTPVRGPLGGPLPGRRAGRKYSQGAALGGPYLSLLFSSFWYTFCVTVCPFLCPFLCQFLCQNLGTFFSNIFKFLCEFLSLFENHLSKDFHVTVAKIEAHFLPHVFVALWPTFWRLSGRIFSCIFSPIFGSFSATLWRLFRQLLRRLLRRLFRRFLRPLLLVFTFVFHKLAARRPYSARHVASRARRTQWCGRSARCRWELSRRTGHRATTDGPDVPRARACGDADVVAPNTAPIHPSFGDCAFSCAYGRILRALHNASWF